jgi:HEAT repeat protein
VPFLDDPDPRVRARAAQALGKLGERRVLDALQAHVGDEASAGFLGKVGEIVQAAIDRLEKR